MKNLILSIFLLAAGLSASAQVIALEDFISVDKMLKKVKKQEFFDGMGYYHLILNQDFTETNISILQKVKGNARKQKYKEAIKVEYLNMPWDKFEELSIMPVSENDNLREVTLRFGEEFTMNYGTSPYQRDFIIIYILTEDEEAMSKTLKAIQKKYRKEK